MVTRYTPAQAAAINCTDKPLQILACAGSGKTQVVSARIGHILSSAAATPDQIVAFTFTEKAAAELQDRILAEVQQAAGNVTGLAEMFVGTMHAYALNLLQTHVPESFKYSVLSEIQGRLLIDRYSAKTGLTSCPTLSPNTPTLKRFIHSRLYQQVLGVLREDEVDLVEVPVGVLDSLNAYMAQIQKSAYFDYTQILLSLVGMLEDLEDPRAEMLRRSVENLRFVVVDEYQDVNPLQERMIRGLVQYGANLCVVGDDDQTIYQWRGSEVRNIVTFSDRYRDVQRVEMGDNFRSSRGVVELGRHIAEGIPADQRLAKTMLAAGHQSYNRGDLLALEFDSPQEEAKWICDRIESMRGLPFNDFPESEPRGISWSDFAVLFRSVSADADELVEEMRTRGIPYVVKGLNRLFDSPEIKAVVGIFRFMVGEVDADALRRMWLDADLVPLGSDFDSAVAVLIDGRDWSKGARWGTYNIQRIYLEFLESLDIKEDTIPGDQTRAELVFYQLGKFSQAISDFEQIYFSSSPHEKYTSFAKWLEYHAPGYYADADLDVGYAQPDAVSISTVHQAKGMQWPAVFIPCLRRNRFPSQRHGGLRLDHVIPPSAIADFDRYLGSEPDERRLFYVAATRAQKWLFASFSPKAKKYAKPSKYLDELTRVSLVLTRDSGVTTLPDGMLPPHPLRATPQVTLSFSELKYLFECPYQFKLRFLYGFNPPLHEALGYGKGLHDALSEVHKRALDGEILDDSFSEELVDRHLLTPFAYPELRTTLRAAGIDALNRYFSTYGDTLDKTVHSEKQIQVHVAPGITVDGRIDLIKRTDLDETSIVDFKSSERAQDESVTRDQLHVYALGYLELTGENADLIEVLNLDPDERSTREMVELPLLNDIRERIRGAGESLRNNDLEKHSAWCSACETCDLVGLCRDRPTGPGS